MLRLFRAQTTAPDATPPATAPADLPRQGAGGVVLARVDGVLRLAAVQPARYGEDAWCLPKGSPDAGEAPIGAALREVREETGLVCEPVARLGVIEYTVVREGARVPKRTEYWLMVPIGGRIDDLVPARRAEIRRARWCVVDDGLSALTHPAEQALVSRALAGLSDLPE